jgi:hypothetical protein
MIRMGRRVEAIAVVSFLVAIIFVSVISFRSQNQISQTTARRSAEFVASQVAFRRTELEGSLQRTVARARTPEVIDLEIELFDADTPGPPVLQIQAALGDRYRSVFIAEPAIRRITLMEHTGERISSYRTAGEQFDFPSSPGPHYGDQALSFRSTGAGPRRTGDTVLISFESPYTRYAPYLVLEFGVVEFSELLIPEIRSRYPFFVVDSRNEILIGERLDETAGAVPVPGTDWTIFYDTHRGFETDRLVWRLVLFAATGALGTASYLSMRGRYIADLMRLVAELRQWDASADEEALPRIKARTNAAPILQQFLRAFAVFPLVPIILFILASLTITALHSREATLASIETQSAFAADSIRQVERRINSASAEIIFDPVVQRSLLLGTDDRVRSQVVGIMAQGVHRAQWDNLQSWSISRGSEVVAASLSPTPEDCSVRSPGASGALGIACADADIGFIGYRRAIRSSIPGSLGRTIGTITLVFDATAMIERAYWAQPSPGGSIDVMTPFGGDRPLSGRGVFDQTLSRQRRNDLVYDYPIPRSDLSLRVTIPRRDVIATVLRSIQTISIGLVLLFALVAAALGWISLVFSRPIVGMARSIARQDRISELDHGHSRISEVAMVAASFNELMDRLDRLIEENYRSRLKVIEEEALLREARLAGLEQQINPHFIFNTLEAMRQFVLEHGQPRLGAYISGMGRLFRYAVQTHNQDSTIGTEVSITLDYVRLQEFRYETDFVGDWMVEPDLEELTCLRFLVQPIVENSFVHGYDGVQPDFRINVQISRRGDHVEIVVRDNGRPASTMTHGGNSVGLKNISDRLHLRYGDTGSIGFRRHESGAETTILYGIGPDHG